MHFKSKFEFDILVKIELHSENLAPAPCSILLREMKMAEEGKGLSRAATVQHHPVNRLLSIPTIRQLQSKR